MRDTESSRTVGSDMRRALRRQKGKGFLVFAAVVAGTVLVTAFSPKSYHSEAKLYVQLGRENSTLDPTATLSREPVVAIPQTRETELNSAVEILMSRTIAEKVVDALGPQAVLGRASQPGEAGPKGGGLAEARDCVARAADWGAQWARRCLRRDPLDDREQAILTLRDGLDAEAVRKSTIVRVSYQAKSPELAQAILAKVIDFYLAEHIGLNRPRGSQEFLSQETDRLRRQLTSTQAELREMKIKTGLVSPSGRGEILAKRIGRLEDELLQTSNEIAGSETKVKQLREALAGLPKSEVVSRTSGVRDQGTDIMRGRFYALEMEAQGARAKYTDEHPKMKMISDQVAAAREALAREPRTGEQVTTGPGRLLDETRLALAGQEPALSALRVKADLLRTQTAAVRGELKQFIRDESRIADLQEASYRTCAMNLRQAQFDDALEAQRISNINVIEPATLEQKPVRPRVLASLALGLAAALFGALTVMFSVEFLDHSLRTEEEVEEKLGTRLLTSIPRFKPAQLVPKNGKH
jgi:uncharacterized protein involved in exopolysaccharide biosynthesis